jgi:small subunit ribosomal protein S6
MRYYETLYLLNPNLAEEDYQEAVSKFNDVIERYKGVVVQNDEWGKRTLAYRVKKFDRGFYVLARFCGGAELISELHREFKLDERVLKFQTVKLSDHEDPDALKQTAEQERKGSEEAERTQEEAASAAPEEAGKEQEG